MNISPTQSNVQAALAAFLSAVLPNAAAPAVFTGYVSGTTLTVTKIIAGAIAANVPLLGGAAGTVINEQLTGQAGGLGTYDVSPSQTTGSTVTGATFSTGVSVLAGQQNRVAEPPNPYFVIFTPIRFTRLATNLDQTEDCKFTGSLAAGVMTVSVVATGSIETGATIFGVNVNANTVVIGQVSGTPGGAGTYDVTGNQTLGSQTLSAGQKTMTQEAESVIQMDFHSPDTLAGDFAQTVSTAIRDEFGTTFFSNLAPPLNGVSPFYADDPAQRPFINAENAYEWRWSLDAHLQVNQTVTVPQTYADATTIDVISVDAEFPP